MNAVIYRYNPTLANLVKNANPEFMHEFPAEMSAEEIKLEFQKVLESAYNKAEELGSRLQLHVDGTVLSALGEELDRWRPRLIRQDDVSAYDYYAERIAEESKQSNQFGEPTVVIVRDRIADHNSEAWASRPDYEDGVALMDAECVAVHGWMQRLQKHGIRVSVVAARDFETELRCGRQRIHDVVVVCDHHNGNLQDLIKQRGGLLFNAFPQFSDSDLLTL